jgi:hypothetical protein
LLVAQVVEVILAAAAVQVDYLLLQQVFQPERRTQLQLALVALR